MLEIDDQGALGSGVTIDTGDGASKGFLSYNQNGTTPTTFGGTIIGDGGLRKEGTGELVLTGNNSYSGGTELNGGVISVDDDTRLGNQTGVLNFNGGTLKIMGTSMTSTDHAITWGNNGGGFDIDSVDNTFTITTDLAGSGSLIKDGAGTLAMTGLDSYAGIVAIKGGVLQIGDGQTSGTLGTGASVAITSGTLAFNRSDDVLVISQVISGNGGLVQAGAGTTTLVGDNSYLGDTDIQAGTLQLGQNGTTGALDPRSTIHISANAKLVISRSDIASPFSFDNLINGDGQVVINGDGRVTLTNTGSSYTGGTKLDDGTLIIGSDMVLGSGDLTLNGGTLRVESPFTMNRAINVLAPNGRVNMLDTAQNLTFSGTLTGSNASSFYQNRRW
ncbi:hypothetical protein HED55_10500 [Ochrobactrum haematophilum]|uniref:Outer membrane autotransporter n=1 Tax=Brucella haematophila TaxID=419474 RepID=A0ABX1DQM8_9HYPH|nr:hypothetical protein [Brucella haematophila]